MSGRFRGARRYKYGAYTSGADPLAPPYDVQAAVDAVGDRVLVGDSLREALRDLLRTGTPEGRAGLDELAARARRRRRELTRSGHLDAGLTWARSRLDQALAAERAELARAGSQDAGSPDADFARARLDALPRSTAAALQELADYAWADEQARQIYDELTATLQQQFLDQRLAGLQQALGAGPMDPRQAAGLRQMMQDLNDLLARHAAGHDTTEDFETFLTRYGHGMADPPQNVDDLVEELARRAAAADQLMRSLPPGQRAELAALTEQSMAGTGLADQMSRLSELLHQLRPDLSGGPARRFTGQHQLGYPDATSALSELAQIEALIDQLDADLDSSLDAVDVELVEKRLGRAAADQVRRLAELEKALREQGWITAGPDGLTLSPKALRRLGSTALRRVFADLQARTRGAHEVRSLGTAGEVTGATIAWRPGDTRPIDTVRTVSNALLRQAGQGARLQGRVELDVEDFAVVETESRSTASVALCVDLSHSMAAEGRWGPMKQTALALAHLVATRYPQDALQIIGFGRHAATLTQGELAAVEPDHQQGTNLAHALALAGRHLRRFRDGDPILLVVTDGEPTAHLDTDGQALFCWPPEPETIEATITEFDHLTRSGTSVNLFMLGQDPGLRRFMDAVARRTGGRMLLADPDNLGEFVITDYLRARRTPR